jgi:predicted dehydrogenase
MSYNVGVVGLGDIGWRYDQRVSGVNDQPLTHTGVYQKNPKTILRGGCSIDEKDREDFSNNFRVPVYSTIEELLASAELDIISICSPSENHFEHVSRCLMTQVPMVWLEKPPAIDLNELRSLMKIQRNNNYATRILVGFQRRYDPVFQNIRQDIRDQKWGELLSVYVTYSKGLLNNGSHYLDLIFFLIGDDLRNDLLYTTPYPSRSDPSFALCFENGVSATFLGLDTAYHCVDINLVFASARVSVLYGGVETRIEASVEHESYPGFYRLKELESSYSKHYKNSENSMENSLLDLISAHQTDREPVSSLSTANSTMTVLERVLKG